MCATGTWLQRKLYKRRAEKESESHSGDEEGGWLSLPATLFKERDVFDKYEEATQVKITKKEKTWRNED